MERKLISSITFGKLQNTSSTLNLKTYWERRNKYDSFLEETPNIGDFVPAKLINGVWIVLEEPMAENYFNVDIPIDKFTDEDGKGLNKYHADLLFWEEAKNRVIFEGFEVIRNFPTALQLRDKNSNTIAYLKNEDCFYFMGNNKSINTIEDLVKYNLTLTEQKAKELGYESNTI